MSGPKNMYVDVLGTNIVNSNTKASNFRFSTDSSAIIINKASDYQMAIVRFQVDSSTAAVFIPEIQPYQPDINKTIYSVTLSINEQTSGPVYVKWRAQDKTASSPLSTANGLQDVSTGYYNCYSYNWWCMLILEAFETALGLLKNDVDIIDNAQPPLIYWNNGSNAATIEAQSEYYDMSKTGPQNCIEIYFNQALFSMFNSFPASFNSFNDPNNQNWRILTYKVGSVNTDVIELNDGSSQEFISVQQEYSTTLSWSPYTSIVFTSSTIPVQGSITLPPQITIDGNRDYSTSQLANTELIITDLQTLDGVYRSSITYSPNLLRYIDLYGQNPISQIDMNIYWRTKIGGLVPFQLGSGGSVSCKIGFFRKS
jgi:hypothetical protein